MQTLADATLNREYLAHLTSALPKDGILKAEVWSADETTQLLVIDDLTPVDQAGQFVPTPGTARACSVTGDAAADIQLTAQLVVDNAGGAFSRSENDPAGWIFAEGNVLKIWMGYRLPSGGTALFPRFWGTIGQATVSLDAASGDSAVSVPAAGVEQRLLDSKFADTTTYSDTVSESANYASSASASSALQAGDALQVGGKLYLVQAFATVLGQRKRITTDQDAGAVIDGSSATGYSITYSEAALTKLELQVRLDLGASHQVRSITPRIAAGTTVTHLRTSTTGFESAWTDQPVAGMVTPAAARYIELIVEASASGGSATVTVNELEALANAAYPASQAVDADPLTFWLPRAGDLDRTITVQLSGSVSFNALYLQWGTNPVDAENPVAYKIYNGDTGALLITQAARVSGLVEHVILGGVTCSSIKIQVTQASGIVALRNVEVLNVTVVNTVTFLLGDMATGAGLTRQRVSNSKLYRTNLTARIGDDYHGRMKEIVEAIGWRLYGAVDGYLVAEPHLVDSTTPVMTYAYGDANFIGSFSVEAATLGARNHVIVLAKLPTATIRGEKKDDAAGSPTSVQRLGDRVHVIEDRLADSQKKADLEALVTLLKETKWRAPRTFEHVANPAHEIWDVIRLEEPVTKTSGNFVLMGFTLQLTPQAFWMQYRVAPA